MPGGTRFARFALPLALAGCAGGFPAVHTARPPRGSAQVLCRLTGPAGIATPSRLDLPLAGPTRAVGVDGTDLGIPFPWQDSWRLLFGDTDTNPHRGPLFHQQTQGAWGPIVPNAVASMPQALPEVCPPPLTWSAVDGRVAPVLPREDGEESVIPGGVVTVGSTVLMHASSVAAWGPGCDTPEAPGNVCVRYGFLARSTDGGAHFTRLPAPRWSLPQRTGDHGAPYTDAGFAQAALAMGEGPAGGTVLWLLGTPSGRRGPVRLAWVPLDAYDTPQAYRYLTGMDGGVPQWGSDPLAAVPVLPAPVGELSVAWLPGLQRWVALRLDVGARALVASTARHPWGPWTDPVVVLDCDGASGWGFYGGFTYGAEDTGPRFTSTDGRWLYFTVSHWATYETYLARVSVDALAPEP